MDRVGGFTLLRLGSTRTEDDVRKFPVRFSGVVVTVHAQPVGASPIRTEFADIDCVVGSTIETGFVVSALISIGCTVDAELVTDVFSPGCATSSVN